MKPIKNFNDFSNVLSVVFGILMIFTLPIAMNLFNYHFEPELTILNFINIVIGGIYFIVMGGLISVNQKHLFLSLCGLIIGFSTYLKYTLTHQPSDIFFSAIWVFIAIIIFASSKK